MIRELHEDNKTDKKYDREWIKVGHAQFCFSVLYDINYSDNGLGLNHPGHKTFTDSIYIQWKTLKFTAISSELLPRILNQENQDFIDIFCWGTIESFGLQKFKDLVAQEIRDNINKTL